jgi:hypothetical protein
MDSSLGYLESKHVKGCISATMDCSLVKSDCSSVKLGCNLVMLGCNQEK